MNKTKAIQAVERAIQRATKHLAGARDESLPAARDSQVQHFLEMLHQMRASLESSDAERVSQKYMGFAIADEWPFESELGKLICQAESGYHSVKER